MNIKKSLLCLFASLAVLSCQKTMQVEVEASFNTDKETYEVYDLINITNTTVVKNSRMAVCKWEYNGKVSYDMPTPEGITFDAVGVYPITLTVTSEEGAVKGTFTKEVTVVDTNPHPVVDFTWSPSEVVAGEEVQFTADATDADGIASYAWTFGTATSTEQNPKYTFKETGDIIVSLKVTDNAQRTTTATKTVTVGRGVNYLDLIWEKAYETTTDAYVYGTSPALNADGSRIYVHSTGYHLVAFDAQGNEQWSFDTSVEGASALNSAKTSIKNQSPTPSVDADGNIYIAVSFDEPKEAFGGVFCIKPDGSKKWYTSYGRGASFRFMSPMIFGDYVATNQRNTGQTHLGDEKIFNGQNFVILDRNSGQLVQYLYCDSGPYGGLAAMQREDGWLLFAHSGGQGTRVYVPFEGLWATPSTGSSTGRPFNLNTGVDAQGSQIAIASNGYVYCLYKDKKVYCYDMASYKRDENATVVWSTSLEGSTSQSGLGCVLRPDGTVIVTMHEAVYALDAATGEIKWTEKADGKIYSVAAVDNAGAVYYNDGKTGKLIKLTPEGKRVVELSLGDNVLEVDGSDPSMKTSPTIGPDGTIYCNAIKGGQPTLFCVKGSATAPAEGWSQLGGDYCKTSALKK